MYYIKNNKALFLRSIICVVAMLALAGGTIVNGGCMETDRQDALTRQNAMERDTALNYLQGKYGEKFVAISLSSNDFMSSTDVLRAYPASGEPDYDAFSLIMAEDGWRDGYYGIAVRSDYEAVVYEVVNAEFGTCRVYLAGYYADFFDNALLPGVPLAEAREQGLMPGADLYAFVQCGDAEAAAETFEKAACRVASALGERRATGFIRILCVREDIFRELTRDNYKDILDDYAKADGENCYAIYRGYLQNKSNGQ